MANKLTQFLMGLNEYYDNARHQILLMDPKPSLNRMYAMLLSIERQREVQSHMNDQTENFAMFMKDNFEQHKGQNNGKSNREGHNQEGCFKLIGYPDWWKGNKEQKSKNAVNLSNTPFSCYEDQPESSSRSSGKLNKSEIAAAFNEMIKNYFVEEKGKGKDTFYEDLNVMTDVRTIVNVPLFLPDGTTKHDPKDNNIIGKGELIQNLYILENLGIETVIENNTFNTCTDFLLLHRRLGHLSDVALKHAYPINKDENVHCDICPISKLKRLPF
ncbi:uncharacterized protein LOC124935584 [Impatiens glandulifera]|uniref:uncharacterized protein LOC124935584 n=1 Tax=Impatiens glandulifera TaxID=253017 RepID=UPI001FB187D2|nr:uncharacterized protein LOC124935584 [Impatiens glandulifera]